VRVAKGKKTGGKNFELGHGLSKGRPPLPQWVKESRRLSTEEFVAALHQLSHMSLERIREISNDESLPVKSIIMANWLVAATTDDKSRQSLFDRLFGKVKETVDLNVSGEIKKLSDADILRILRDHAHLLGEGAGE